MGLLIPYLGLEVFIGRDPCMFRAVAIHPHVVGVPSSTRCAAGNTAQHMVRDVQSGARNERQLGIRTRVRRGVQKGLCHGRKEVERTCVQPVASRKRVDVD